jgi:hypothetical protein
MEHLPTALSYAKQVGCNPWLIVNPSINEAEWGNLVDYLCAPAGVGYASRRPANHPGPYTSDFSTIYLEFGNEEWGTQTTATTYPTTQEKYGAYGHYMISQAIAGKSYFDKNKIKFVANGFTLNPSNTTSIMKDFTEASLVDYFSYSGGDSSLTGDACYQNELLSVPEGVAASNGSGGSGGVGVYLAQDAQSQKSDAAGGLNYQTSVYEGGPGSDAPGSTTTGDDSLAAATTAIDQALACSLNGFGPQNFFLCNLGTGPYSSHLNFAGGLIPHPVWEALKMRNRYCAGDMVEVTTNTVPVTTDGKSAPLIATYAFHNGTNYDVAVVSRDLNNTTPVTLHLPEGVNAGATLYTLTGDPRANNNSSLIIPIGTQSLTNFKQDYTFNMPAGSFYVFQAVASGAALTAAPTFTPSAGTYTTTQNVAITSSTPGSVIYFTTDGSTPTTSSAVYSSPVAVSASETLKAIAVSSAYSDSAVSTSAYVIHPGGGSSGTMVSWNFSGKTGDETSDSPTTVDTNVTATSLARGSGLLPEPPGYSTYQDLANTFSFYPNGNQFGSTLAASQANNDYASFSITPNSGFKLSLSQVKLAEFYYLGATTLVPALEYSTDGTNFTPGSFSPGTSGSTGSPSTNTVDVSGIPALQNSSATVTLRVYFYDTASNVYVRAGLGPVSGDSLSVTGSTSHPALQPTFSPAAGTYTTLRGYKFTGIKG